MFIVVINTNQSRDFARKPNGDVELFKTYQDAKKAQAELKKVLETAFRFVRVYILPAS